jgi:hypothetical protein
MTIKTSSTASPNPSEPTLYTIRGHRVIVDSDLARIYGTTTGRFNEAFKRNLERFPADSAFQLTREEAANLISQFATSSLKSVTEIPDDHGGRRKLPWVFTEHGTVMAANILRGEKAVRMSVFVVRAFIRMREQVSANEAILARLAEIDDRLLEHDDTLRDLYEKLLMMLEPPAEPPPKRTMGFRVEEG